MGRVTELAARLDEILWVVWDPIGVNDTPEARGEYTSYAHRVATLLLRGVADDEIARYLRQVQLDAMGLPRVDAEREAATLAALRQAADGSPLARRR